MKTGIVVTGLPASGKTTIARSIAESLSFTLLDKDDFLETLYAENPVQTWQDRKELSRQADALFQAAATRLGSAVLVSHWKPPHSSRESGTASDWLNAAFSTLIEVYCACPPDLALNRFLARKRHPGHCDAQRDPAELASQLRGLAPTFPLGIGPVITVNTDKGFDDHGLMRALHKRLNDAAISR
jgi:glucokinase